VLLAAVEAGPLRFATTFTKHPAGTETNFAVGLARLGHQVGWFSRVGEDEFGQFIVNFVRGEGVDTSRVIVDPEAPTGILFKEKRELGPRKIQYYRRGSAASRLSPADLDLEYLADTRYLHITGITPALSETACATVFEAARHARSRGVKVSFDPNLRLRLWTRDQARETMRALLPLCDVVLPGLDEAELLVGESDPERAAEALRALGPALAVVKLGPNGALAVGPEGRVRAPGLKLERIVDPVGAGDGFAAGFIAGQLRGLDLAHSLAIANSVGAFATTVVGDVEGLPTWREVQDLRLDLDVAR
jgi:2-dehydro-3-deoxygluconokinase